MAQLQDTTINGILTLNNGSDEEITNVQSELKALIDLKKIYTNVYVCRLVGKPYESLNSGNILRLTLFRVGYTVFFKFNAVMSLGAAYQNLGDVTIPETFKPDEDVSFTVSLISSGTSYNKVDRATISASNNTIEYVAGDQAYFERYASGSYICTKDLPDDSYLL